MYNKISIIKYKFTCLIVLVVLFIATSSNNNVFSWGDFKEYDGFGSHVEDSCLLFKISTAAQDYMENNRIKLNYFSKYILVDNKIFKSILKTAFAVSIRKYSANNLNMIVFYSPKSVRRGSYPRTEYIITKGDIYTIDHMREYYIGNVFQLMNEFIIDDGWQVRKDYKFASPKKTSVEADEDEDEEDDDEDEDEDDDEDEDEDDDDDKGKGDKEKITTQTSTKPILSRPKPQSYVVFIPVGEEIKKPAKIEDEDDDEDEDEDDDDDW